MNDNMFTALAHAQRRQFLFDLLDHNPQETPRSSPSPREGATRNEELVSKHHVHLPKLADYGYIEWDRDAGLVTKGPRFDEIRPLLEFLDGRRD